MMSVTHWLTSAKVPMAHWFLIWDSVMSEDTAGLDSVLSHTGWNVKSYENWELYDIIARFKRWECMKVVLAKVPLGYLKYRYAKELSLPYGNVLLGLIRAEVYKRGYIKVLLQVHKLPDDIIREVWQYLI